MPSWPFGLHQRGKKTAAQRPSQSRKLGRLWRMGGVALAGAVVSTLAPVPHGKAVEESLCLRKAWPLPSFLVAVYDTLNPQDCERWPHLTPLRPDNPDLIWRGDQVLMVVWTRTCTDTSPPHAIACLDEGDTYDVPVRESYALWVTAAPEVRAFIQRERAYNPTFSMAHLGPRLEQYLGLKPQGLDRTFVELWVNRADLLRPCLDEDPTDTQCDLWHPDHLEPGTPFAQAVGSGDPRERYPFTGLGYTYDWGNPHTDVGVSEFVVRGGATVTIHRKTATHAYATDDRPPQTAPPSGR